MYTMSVASQYLVCQMNHQQKELSWLHNGDFWSSSNHRRGNGKHPATGIGQRLFYECHHTSMFKMPETGEDHGNGVFLGFLYRIFVSDGTTRLNDSAYFVFSRLQNHI